MSNPDRDQIEALITALAEDAVDPWEPVSWREIDDPDDESYRVVVTFQFEALPHQQRRFGPDKHEQTDHGIVIQAVRALEDETDHGAPVEMVQEAAAEEGVENVPALIVELKNRGEIYAPREDYLKPV